LKRGVEQTLFFRLLLLLSRALYGNFEC
jgi:hypothetical protein